MQMWLPEQDPVTAGFLGGAGWAADGWGRTLAFIPAIYLGAFVWENLLVEQTAGATRFLLLGALLVVLMNARPQGLFGTARVEIA